MKINANGSLRGKAYGAFPRARWDREPCPTCGAGVGQRCRQLDKPRRFINGSHRMRSPYLREAVERASR